LLSRAENLLDNQKRFSALESKNEREKNMGKGRKGIVALSTLKLNKKKPNKEGVR
jgi:hypothetical protein